jgi:hypothetical protein
MNTDEFTCDDGQGVTAGYAAGNYTVSIDAFTNAGKIGDAPLINAAIQDRNSVTNLGSVDISLQ